MASISPFISTPGDRAGFVHVVRDTLSHNQHAVRTDTRDKGWRSEVRVPDARTRKGDTDKQRLRVCREAPWNPFPLERSHQPENQPFPPGFATKRAWPKAPATSTHTSLCPALQLSGIYTQVLPFSLCLCWEAPPRRVAGTIPHRVLSQSIPAQPSLPLPWIPRLMGSGPPGGSHSDPHYMNRETSFDWEMKADSQSDSSCTHLHKLSHPIPLQMQKFNYRALHFHLENKAAALYPCSLFWGWVCRRGFCCCSAFLRALLINCSRSSSTG